MSLNEGKVPNDWKKAIVVPIFKKKDPQCAANYRHVSFTSVVCNILGRIIRQQLIDYLTRNNLYLAKAAAWVSVTNICSYKPAKEH